MAEAVPPAPPRRVARGRRWAAGLSLALLLAAVFALYLSPHFAFDLASRVWACF